MKFYYSANNNGFYCDAFKESYLDGVGWPDDAVEIDNEIYNKYKLTPPQGKALTSDEQGFPTWVSVVD